MKGENSVKLFGNDLQTLTDTANKIKAVLATVPGITDLAVFTSLGQPTVQIDIDRARAARYGLAPGDINATIRVAIGGDSGGRPLRARQRPALPDRRAPGAAVPPEPRSDPAHHASARRAHNGVTQIPLSEVATVKLVSGASFIYREQQERYVPIKFSVRDRDLGSAIAGSAAARSPSRCSCRPASGSNGSASSATCRTRSRGWRSSCRSASR